MYLAGIASTDTMHNVCLIHENVVKHQNRIDLPENPPIESPFSWDHLNSTACFYGIKAISIIIWSHWSSATLHRRVAVRKSVITGQRGASSQKFISP